MLTGIAGLRELTSATPHALAASAGMVGALVLIGVVALTADSPSSDADRTAVARDTFARHTAAFADSGEFTDVTVAANGETIRTCGRHTRNGRADPGRYTLCLLIGPELAAGERVTGSYKTNGASGRHDCRGAARAERLCR